MLLARKNRVVVAAEELVAEADRTHRMGIVKGFMLHESWLRCLVGDGRIDAQRRVILILVVKGGAMRSACAISYRRLA